MQKRYSKLLQNNCPAKRFCFKDLMLTGKRYFNHQIALKRSLIQSGPSTAKNIWNTLKNGLVRIPLFEGNWVSYSISDGMASVPKKIGSNQTEKRFEKPLSKCYQNCYFINLSVQYREVHIAEKMHRKQVLFFILVLGVLLLIFFNIQESCLLASDFNSLEMRKTSKALK